jgi:hypothetical protein
MIESGRNDRQAQKKKLQVMKFNAADSALRSEFISKFEDYDDRTSCNNIIIITT